jgi:hypothetical protein
MPKPIPTGTSAAPSAHGFVDLTSTSSDSDTEETDGRVARALSRFAPGPGGTHNVDGAGLQSVAALAAAAGTTVNDLLGFNEAELTELCEEHGQNMDAKQRDNILKEAAAAAAAKAKVHSGPNGIGPPAKRSAPPPRSTAWPTPLLGRSPGTLDPASAGGAWLGGGRGGSVKIEVKAESAASLAADAVRAAHVAVLC